jgi:hypothetical protein
MTTVNTIGNFQAAGNAPGVVPLGAIIAMTTGLSGAMAIPASGVVSNGYMRADGTAIPASNAVSGTAPDLSGSIYLRGSTSYGGTGGTNNTTLSDVNLPPHFHSISHDHASVTSTGMSANLTHSHGITDPGHYHNEGIVTANAGALPLTYFVNNVISGTSRESNNAGWTTDFASTGITINSSSLEHTHNVDLPNFTGNSGNGPGTSTSFTNEPSYINVIYLIRVN